MRGFLLLLTAGLLTGCSLINPYSSEFSCPGYRPGVCGSIEDVYRMYKQGKFSREENTVDATFRYAPQECRKKVVCEECEDACGEKMTCCRKVTTCRPESVTKHIDYRAKAVKSNEYQGEIVW
jgi:hypothetical protein